MFLYINIQRRKRWLFMSVSWIAFAATKWVHLKCKSKLCYFSSENMSLLTEFWPNANFKCDIKLFQRLWIACFSFLLRHLDTTFLRFRWFICCVFWVNVWDVWGINFNEKTGKIFSLSVSKWFAFIFCVFELGNSIFVM